MSKCARFAALSLSALLALPLLAADLRRIRDPYLIEKVFPAKAKVRVLNFWATWCAPCVAEMPDLRAIDEMFGREVAITGVSLDDMIPDTKPRKVSAFLEKHRIAFPNVYYTGNVDALARYFNVSGELPVTIVYDGEGKELWRHEGRIDKDQTVARLREALKETP